MHEVLVNRLGGLSLPRKRVVRLTDRTDMTLDVYRGRKTTIQQLFKRQQADDKKYVCKFSKKLCQSWEFKDYRANSVELDEVAHHHEPPKQDLRCLQFSFFHLWYIILS